MKYKLITTGLIAGAFLLFGGHAMADDAVDKNRSANECRNHARWLAVTRHQCNDELHNDVG